ncbi:MAG: DUF3090 domain-containing protein [Deltaproteobacteria bacterium]|nr:DUF3090 domain-containing protein [Deltaproteobacteria bacterium]MBI3076278.1 DUF3090 domain-containing protein [Deltaproteobacteria bacterium]
MPGISYELNPVTRITAGAVGTPGKRTFYIQARRDRQVVTLLCEKQHVEVLGRGIEEFLKELQEKSPDLPGASDAFDPASMALEEPLEPAFHVGQLGLGYDRDNDLLVLVARELVTEEMTEEEASSARFWATRSQMRAMAKFGLEVVKRGRPICPACRRPMDPEGHLCPRSNGHAH